MGILSNELARSCNSILKFLSLYWTFHQNRPVTGSRVSFIGNRGSIKSIKERGGQHFFFNLLITRLPLGLKCAKLRLPPQNRSFSRCILRQTPTLAGSNGRIEPNYFLYRDASFLPRCRNTRCRVPDARCPATTW